MTSHRTLRILAALTWCSGGVVLMFKGGALLVESYSLWANHDLTWVAPVVGVGIGLLKVTLLFNRFCARNLERIDALEHPKVWQFFRPGFFLFLAAMVVLGATLSRMALDSYPLLLFMVALDLSLATALLGSLPVFWKYERLTS